MKLRLTASDPTVLARPRRERPPTQKSEPPSTLPFPSGAVRQMHEAARALRQERLDRVTHRRAEIQRAEAALREVESHTQALLNQLATEARAGRPPRPTSDEPPEPTRAA